MFKSVLELLDKSHSDVISDRIDKEPIVAKYWFNLGGAILFSIITVLLAIVAMLKYDVKSPPATVGVNVKNHTGQQLVTLPFPHQSFKNVSAWIVDAVTAAYSFDFNNYDAQVERAAYYFTPDGYKTYLTALDANKIRQNVVGRKLQIAVVPMQNPVLINGGTFGSTEFWRFKIPVLVSYYGGKEPVVKKTMIELLVLRVPAYQNYKGLSITEFNMSPI